MAKAVTQSPSTSFIFSAIYNLERRIENYRIYRNTVRELSKLSERQLLDLNLCRADIERVAREAVLSR